MAWNVIEDITVHTEVWDPGQVESLAKGVQNRAATYVRVWKENSTVSKKHIACWRVGEFSINSSSFDAVQLMLFTAIRPTSCNCPPLLVFAGLCQQVGIAEMTTAEKKGPEWRNGLFEASVFMRKEEIQVKGYSSILWVSYVMSSGNWVIELTELGLKEMRNISEEQWVQIRSLVQLV